MAVETLPLPVLADNGAPFCPFCGGVMVESEDHTKLTCVACRTDAVLEVWS
jgi:NADH pyrophosphatase NudC (nudix superfamily)